MNELRRKLPKPAWARIYRITGLVTAASVVLSIVLTHVFMETFSAGINVQGFLVAMLMPILLGTPLVFGMMFKHEQLRFANEQLETIATVDWLTDCLNRGAFTRRVVRQLSNTKDETSALLIIDADDFKLVNDLHGHDSGDKALQLIADAIRGTAHPNAIVGRLGGEEFGVFLANTHSTQADVMAENIRLAISKLSFSPNGIPCPLSVSIGGAMCEAASAFGEVYRQADQRLYEAKNGGRDRVAPVQAAYAA